MDRTEALDKFIEQDIKEFLDKKAGNSLEFGFAEKLQKLLDASDYDAAFNLISERIKEYNSSENNASRAIIFTAIKNIIPRISSQHSFDSRLEKLSFLLRNELQNINQPPQRINSIDGLLQTIEEENKKKLNQAQKTKDELEPRIENLTKQIFLSIRKKDVKKSIMYYKNLKKIFAIYPSIFKERKTEIYNDIVSLYVQITKIKKDVELIEKNTLQDTIKNNEEKKSVVKKIGVEHIEKIIQEIKEDTRKKDFDSAKEKIIQLRHIASRIPSEYKHIRLTLESKIGVISQNVELVKRMNKDGINLAKEDAVKYKGTAN